MCALLLSRGANGDDVARSSPINLSPRPVSPRQQVQVLPPLKLCFLSPSRLPACLSLSLYRFFIMAGELERSQYSSTDSEKAFPVDQKDASTYHLVYAFSCIDHDHQAMLRVSRHSTIPTSTVSISSRAFKVSLRFHDCSHSTFIVFVEDDSPYPEVRSAVANTDDPNIPVSTLRAYVMGILWVVIIAGLNQFFFFRYPSVTISGFIAQLLAFPLGRAWAKVRLHPSLRRKHIFSGRLLFNPIRLYQTGVFSAFSSTMVHSPLKSTYSLLSWLPSVLAVCFSGPAPLWNVADLDLL